MKFYDAGSENHQATGHSRLRKSRRIEKAFRVLEFLVLLYVVSRFSPGISISFKFSGERFCFDSDTIISSRFVFLVVNAIIVTLVLGSGILSENEVKKVTDYYDEYIKKRPNSPRKATKSTEIPPEINIFSAAVKKPDTQTAMFHGGVDGSLAPQSNFFEELEHSAVQTTAIRGRVDSGLVPQPNIVAIKAAGEIPIQPKPVANKETIKENVNQRTPINSRKKSPVIGISASKAEDLTGEELRHKAEAFIERQRRFLLGA